MKDLEWLKEEVVEVMRPKNVIGKTWYQLSDDILRAVDQIEQPELPVLPDFVADDIERNKRMGVSLIGVAELTNTTDMIQWLSSDKNKDVYARAYLDGYTVKKKRHAVMNKSGNNILGKLDGKVIDLLDLGEDTAIYPYLDLALTEQEIKDFDPRYWDFAEEINE